MKQVRILASILFTMIVGLVMFALMGLMAVPGVLIATGSVVAGGTVTQQAATGGDSYDESEQYLDMRDVQRKVEEYKPYQTPLLTLLSQNSVGSTDSWEKKYYAVDARELSTTVSAATTIVSDVSTLTVADASLFTKQNTLLFTGITTEEHAQHVAKTLTTERAYSGWGIRTVSVGEPRYNPMSYHNGSIWPHDNALIAAGFARYKLKDETIKILTGLFDASIFFDLHRLPELFCGFSRRHGESPTLYPVACSPQTWASGAVFLLLESCLGLKVLGSEKRVVFSKPSLPESLHQITIQKLRIGTAELDLLITRHEEGDVSINVLRREGSVEVVVQK